MWHVNIYWTVTLSNNSTLSHILRSVQAVITLCFSLHKCLNFFMQDFYTMRARFVFSDSFLAFYFKGVLWIVHNRTEQATNTGTPTSTGSGKLKMGMFALTIYSHHLYCTILCIFSNSTFLNYFLFWTYSVLQNTSMHREHDWVKDCKLSLPEHSPPPCVSESLIRKYLEVADYKLLQKTNKAPPPPETQQKNPTNGNILSN